MKVLVTGSNGQVGTCLVKQLSEIANVSFWAVDRTELDITDEKAVKNSVKRYSPDVIINAAAYTAVDKAEAEVKLSYLVNREGARYLAEAANDIGATILHISTDYVFAGDKDGMYDENDSVRPQGVYGQSKLEGEVEVAKACPRHIILRTAWVFSEYGNNFVKTMLRLADNRDSLGIVADQFGGPTYAGDIAKALIYIANKSVNRGSVSYGIYHFSGLPHVSWYEFAKAVFDKAKEQCLLRKEIIVSPINTEDYPTLAKRPANSTLDTKKINSQFGIQPSNWLFALNNLSEYK
ncbi:dTDP-4-dehydrorhamnose reductase [Shewanella cyperi]|uniref:dTDP-4-dehydrorhamnose reductase n=1 Tax=Shewanella cyperi TaxID=2814292 RepID=A0A974XII1_9GAMM|nr:dTDP-4-dehydrorhamnose reductase [Shewanella cyperi]QSX28919.1 dTDP-4-dehydrorhamnose reductase [Shewanella cyperi]